ncbi:16S rRNA (uracil(1498)-N(3))-methyltransferase [Rhodanobacter lindaniclasticus]
MRAIRLHADLPLAVGGEFTLPADAAEHAARVLRLPEGAALVLFNGDGCDYAATIGTIDKRAVRVQVTACRPVHNESPLPLWLAQGIARGDKMDLIVQKATELGVAGIVPLVTERSEVRLDAARAAKRVAHWQSVATSACEQSGRARIPQVLPIQTLAGWLDALPDDGALRLALLPQAAQTIGELRFGTAGGVLVIGPEGGLGEADIRALTQHGFAGLRLGPRILRTETAGLAALSALQACHGDLANATAPNPGQVSPGRAGGFPPDQ